MHHMEWRKIIFRIGLVLGLVIFLHQAWESYQALGQQGFHIVRPFCLLASLSLCMLANFLQMGAWVIILRFLGWPIGLRQTLQGFLISFLPRYIPGGIWGYLSRGQWLQEFYGIDYAVSMVGSLLEALGLILTALSITAFFLLTRLTEDHNVWALFIWTLSVLFLWLFLPMPVLKFARFIWPGLESPSKSAKTQSGNFLASRFFLLWLLVGLIYAMFWTTYGGSLLFIAMAVSPALTSSLLGATFSIAMAWVLGFVAFFVPIGIGVREVALSRFLVSSLALTAGQGSLVAVISRLSIILAELIWLVIGLLLSIPLSAQKSAHHTCSECHGSK